MDRERTKQIAVIAMLSALAFIVMFAGRIPMMSMPGLTLKYDPKDVIIIIGGFMYGPFAAAAISSVVSFFEMIFASETGLIGLVMNIVSSCSFACVAAAIYKYRRTLAGAVTGLIAGVLLTAGTMVLWNYLITPLYLGFPRMVVVPYLMPFFLPFNLVKGTINAAISMMIYKPVSRVMRIVSNSPKEEEKQKVNSLLVVLAAAVVVVLSVAAVMFLV